MKTTIANNILIAIATMLVIACGRTSVPTSGVNESGRVPIIVPDYTDIVIPPNIAPMNFEIMEQGKDYITRVTNHEGTSIEANGKMVKWDEKSWHRLLEASRGTTLSYDVFVQDSLGSWTSYHFENSVASDDIDPYLSYRLIEPSYEQYAGMTINQRDLTSFDESVVFNTPAPCDERRGFCINCHVPRRHYQDGSSQFHVRKNKAGTVIMSGDSVTKVNLKTDGTISAGVYPAWHPNEDLIAYSTNDTHQRFFPFGDRKVEVYDSTSDIILYDMKTREVSDIAASPELLETFPEWAPDGKKIFYSVARYPEGVTPETVMDNYELMRYDIVCREFDPVTRLFSEPDTVVYASAHGESALLPRVSPDGKFLLYCKAPFGTFHIWHKDSDLYLLDLTTGEERPLTNANSDNTDSYHTWSSNSRWIVFSSRRDDGSYTRPYIAHVTADGIDSKAFVLPQETPCYYRNQMKSYNVPEFFACPFNVSRQKIVRELDKDAVSATRLSSPQAPASSSHQ